MNMDQSLVSRNVTICGHRTSLRMETITWEALEEVCKREDTSIDQVCSAVELQRSVPNRTSAIRAFIINYFWEAMTELEQFRGVAGRNL